MPPQNDDTHRPTRQRANTSAFSFPGWRRGRPDNNTPTPAPPVVSSPLQWEALIEALTPPAVPSLSYARSLASALGTISTHTSPPRLATLLPILASLCADDSPVPLQTAGFDILAAFFETHSSAIVSTVDRLSCFPLFVDVPWSRELWESRSKAFSALISSDQQTLGMESQILRMLQRWIERAFEGIMLTRMNSHEVLLERQRCIESLTTLLIRLVRKSEFISRLTERDTVEMLELWESLLNKALSLPGDFVLGSPTESPVLKPQSSKKVSPPKLTHRRHHSSTSLPKLSHLKHPTDIVVDAYLTYLSERLNALAHTYLSSILPYLFRALFFYSAPLPRISLEPLEANTSQLHSLEQRVSDLLCRLVTGPYGTSCRRLLKHHFLPSSQSDHHASIQTSAGALRTLRLSIRRVLEGRLARAYIDRAVSVEYSPSGAPTRIALERNLVERAWSNEDNAPWELMRFANILARAAREWIAHEHEASHAEVAHPKEDVLHEIAAIVKDVIQAMNERGEGVNVDDEEVEAVGRITRELVVYMGMLKTTDGLPVNIALNRPDGTSPFASAIANILAQDLRSTPLFPVLPSIILSTADHLSDHDLTQLLVAMADRQCLSPTSLLWIDDWRRILTMPDLFTPSRSSTRQNVMMHLRSVWEFVKDIPAYRRPLASLIFDIWQEQSRVELEDTAVLVVWNLLADEAVLRLVEKHTDDSYAEACETQEGFCEDILNFLLSMAHEQRLDDDDDAASVLTVESSAPSPAGIVPPNTTTTSPILSRMTTEYSPPREKETAIPSMMSLFTSLTTGMPSRSQSKPRRPINEMVVSVEAPLPVPTVIDPVSSTPRSVGAVIALVSVFSQLSFTPLAHSQCNKSHAKRMFQHLMELISTAGCVRARLTVLQFLMRLRVDRDHRLYYAQDEYDKDGNIASLAALINRAEAGPSTMEDLLRDDELRRARVRAPQERDGRKVSRGRGGQPRVDPSRSRSRVPSRMLPTAILKTKARDPLWSIPETLLLSVAATDVASEGMMSYDPSNPGQTNSIIQSALYLSKLVEIIENEQEWEILSYVLCHLPTQLANKHLFCGPRSKTVIEKLLSALCTGIVDGTLAKQVERWPDGIISRDAHGLAFHTLTILISYKRCFETAQPLHRLVEVFLLGLNGQPTTQKCCLHALSLSAFELQSSMTKYLSRIMEKLSQIMSNPSMAVHIIDFLAVVGSQHSLYVNFTESDYKMVFAVALKYLEHHNRVDGSISISWALSQHVRIMSYYIVYVWFLALDIPDRERHVSYIVRQLLLANGGRADVDTPTEVAFDWLARYTYASADPRPAKSTLDEIVMNPRLQSHDSEPAIREKTWILGNNVVTIRALARRGWIEVLSRRASGLTKFLVRAENVPIVPLGDVDPDLVSISAMLMMDREDDGTEVAGDDSTEDLTNGNPTVDNVKDSLSQTSQSSKNSPRPDPVTGYVWSKSAPSQRRKDVTIDPSFFALQLSAYPDKHPAGRGRLVTDKSKLASFFRTFDRMPVIDTHKVGVMYVAPGQKDETEILRNTHGSPAYTRFLEGLGRLIYLRGQVDVYDGGLDPDIDGEYAYAWWDDIGQILFHTATLMPNGDDPNCTSKKAHIGNDYVRVVWNDSGKPYRFDTLSTQFQFVNIVIEPHSRGAIAAFSNNIHEHEYFKVTVQRAPNMVEFTPIGDFKIISAANLSKLVRQISLLADWYVTVWQSTDKDTRRDEVTTNWRSRLEAIRRFQDQTLATEPAPDPLDSLASQQRLRDFTTAY